MRLWLTWTIFGLCLTVCVAIMGWLSATTLRLEAQMHRHVEEEDNIRLALLRMESAIQVLLARENARPFYVYTPTYNLAEGSSGGAATCRVDSPLRSVQSAEVQLYFQVDPEGRLASPQIPEDSHIEAVETTYRPRLERLQSLVDPESWSDLCPRTSATALAMAFLDNVVVYPSLKSAPQVHSAPDASEWPKLKTSQEYQWRTQAFQQHPPLRNTAGDDVQQDLLQAAWVKDELLLARRVTVGGLEYFQGCWLDWSVLRGNLLSMIADLLPGAALVPVDAGLARSGENLETLSRMLVGLPLRLLPGQVPKPPAASGMSSIQQTLLLSWSSLILAAVACAVVLRSVIVLSARRGDFVSAVTHELRTPLTTFQMYTEMLAEDMVSEQKRRGYLERLRTEAQRLGHLVENVLAYARLEQGRRRKQLETVRLEDLFEHARERLTSHSQRSGMNLIFDANGAADAWVRTDRAAAEQVLFNLVDNACKYASSAGDRRIHVEALAGPRVAGLRVRDHGPGLSRAIQRRLFKPFSKSETDAANSAPGVGLGLSLCRRLARDLGGDLLYESRPDGASFVLQLPKN